MVFLLNIDIGITNLALVLLETSATFEIQRVLKMVLVDPILQEQRGAMGPNFGRWDFDISSFNLLYEDPTVQHIYSNGELEIFYVEGTRNPHLKWSQ